MNLFKKNSLGYKIKLNKKRRKNTYTSQATAIYAIPLSVKAEKYIVLVIDTN